MYKIGLSTNGGDFGGAVFASFAAAGISCAEISTAAENYADINYKAFRENADRYGVELWSYHLPFAPFSEIDPSSTDEGIRKHTVEYFMELIKKGSEIGINKFIVHPSGEPISDEERSERLKCSKDTLSRLAELAWREGATLCVEDIPRTCLCNHSFEMKEIMMADDRLRVCFDTNHLLKQDNAEFIRELGDRIVTLHVSDYDFINERHWLPGEGKNNWQEILKELKNVGYNGPWMYEIGYHCPKTICRDRDLTDEDFVRNARELFENKPITIFSSPIENLGMWGPN